MNDERLQMLLGSLLTSASIAGVPLVQLRNGLEKLLVDHAAWVLAEKTAQILNGGGVETKVRLVVDHSDHGRGDESGPEDPDCPCRATQHEQACAEAGCGFCKAALKR